MAAGKYNLRIEQGTTVNIDLQYVDNAETPIDLTGYTGRMQIKSDYANNNPITYLTATTEASSSEAHITFSGSLGNNTPSDGVIGIHIPAATTAAFDFCRGRYDLELVSGSNVTRLLEGVVILSKEVTTYPV